MLNYLGVQTVSIHPRDFYEYFNIIIFFGSSPSQGPASFNNFTDLLSIIFPAKIKVKSNL